MMKDKGANQEKLSSSVWVKLCDLCWIPYNLPPCSVLCVSVVSVVSVHLEVSQPVNPKSAYVDD